jgi:alkylhydroperoxidase/carboxymuconolactone decarboxylase family protein YurZ
MSDNPISLRAQHFARHWQLWASRHIKNALKAGASMEEIMEVLKLCVVQGVQACNMGVPILAEELAKELAL